MSIVKKYLTELVDIKNPLQNIYTIVLKSKNGKFKYKAGQFLHLTVDDYDGYSQWPESRCFSIQTSPVAENIKLTFSVKGKYTEKIKNNLKLGNNFWIKLPYGDVFQRQHSTNNCIFIAGGTGITPFLSLFSDINFKKYKGPVLFLGLKSKKYNIYYDDLETAVKINPSLKINIIYENEQGFVNINEIINKHVKESTYFISGPPLMIKNFKKNLLANNISENLIITDDWE